MRVLLFGPLAEAAGTRELALDLPAGSRVADLLAALVAAHPALAPWQGRLAVAVNREYAPADRLLAPGDEVALVPPVSGGAQAVWLRRDPLDPAALAARVAHPGAGAVVVFAGTVRAETAGRRTLALEYEAYEPMATAELARIAAEAAARWPGARIAAEHRLGELRPGEVSVVVAASAPHRAEAFAACRYVVDELKRRVPIWKRERYDDGSVWVGQDGTHPCAVAPRGRAAGPTSAAVTATGPRGTEA